MHTLYWIHLPEHKDITSEGYVGITKNLEARIINHRQKNSSCLHLYHAIDKYGWDSLVVKTVYKDDNEQFIALLENILRPDKKIGWNIAPGGFKPPSWQGKTHKTATKNKIGNAHRNKGYDIKCTNLETQAIWVCKINDLIQRGFHRANVYKVIAGQAISYKKHKFERIPYADPLI